MSLLDDALRIIPQTSDNCSGGAMEIKKKINDLFDDLLPLLLAEEKIAEKRLADIKALISQLKGISDSSDVTPAAEMPASTKALAGKPTRYVILKVLQGAKRPMKAAEIIQEIRRINPHVKAGSVYAVIFSLKDFGEIKCHGEKKNFLYSV